MAAHDDSARARASGIHLDLQAPLALLAAVSSVVGRALAPALPGSVAGIAAWIRALNWLSSFLAQLFAVGGIMIAARLVGGALRAKRQDLLFKLTALPVTVLVGLVVLTRMRLDYSEPRSSLALALASGCLALAAAPRLIQVASSRAAGLALALSGLTGLMHAVGHGMALQANLEASPGRFVAARAIETAAMVGSIALVMLAALWLFKRQRASQFKVAALLLIVGLITHASLEGSGPEASLPEVLAARSMGHLMREPAPFLPVSLRIAQLLLQMGLSFWVVLARRPGMTPPVLCLCLVSVGATDIPLLALALTLAALMTRSTGFEQSLGAAKANVSSPRAGATST